MDQESKFILGGLLPGLGFVILIWMVFLLEAAFELDISFLGVLPRDPAGLPGILFSPLIHGDLSHLLSNTFPFFLLSGVIFYAYPRVAGKALIWIYFVAGFWLWCFGREGTYHIGASGVVYGLAGFLFFMGIFRKNRSALSVSLLVLLLYSGLLEGLFPKDPQISWEGHLTGLIAGAFVAYNYRKNIPATDKKKYHYLEKEDPYLDYLATEVYNPYKKKPTIPASRKNSTKPFNSLKINYIIVKGDRNKNIENNKNKNDS